MNIAALLEAISALSPEETIEIAAAALERLQSKDVTTMAESLAGGTQAALVRGIVKPGKMKREVFDLIAQLLPTTPDEYPIFVRKDGVLHTALFRRPDNVRLGGRLYVPGTVCMGESIDVTKTRSLAKCQVDPARLVTLFVGHIDSVRYGEDGTPEGHERNKIVAQACTKVSDLPYGCILAPLDQLPEGRQGGLLEHHAAYLREIRPQVENFFRSL